MAGTIGIFEVSFVLASLMPTYELAYWVWFVNIVDVFIAVSVSLFIFEVTGKVEKFKWYLRSVVGVAFAIFFSALLYPTLFLPQVTPKLYFPWYLDGGPLYVVMLVFFIGTMLYAFYKLFESYLQTKRRDYEYYLIMFAIGSATGPLNFFLVFDYPVDPIYGFAVGLSTLPLAYGILSDDLLDIRIIAKRALVYSLGIGITVSAITLLIFLNNQIVATIPWVQFWTIPAFAGVGAFVVGHLFWRSAVESDRLKSQFVTVATHKLRTPLRQINWALKALREESLSADAKKTLSHIEHANIRLIELTNIIFESTEENASEHAYARDPIDLLSLTKQIVHDFQSVIDRKHITVNVHADEAVHVQGDTRRLRSVVEVFLENALAYSPDNSLIQIITYTKNKRAYFSIRDQGIGVEPHDQAHIFSRFYRTDAAKRKDTEGVGLGLAMAKNIIKGHHGRVGIESPGVGKGSTFWFWVPAKGRVN